MAGGVGDEFIQNLTDRVLTKQKIVFDEKSDSIKQKSYNLGQQYSKGFSITAAAYESWFTYPSFHDEVWDKLIEVVGY